VVWRLDPALRAVRLVPEEIGRVVLNLVSNALYAMESKRKARDDGYAPELVVTTRDLGDRVEIRVRDNGSGIPAAVREKVFNPFFTTKPTGEGTGLGLSISYDIVVQGHGGTMTVESEEENFTEFCIVLPKRAQ
jgi:signal transduction histidine kinase